jgi:O-antigen ligase
MNIEGGIGVHSIFVLHLFFSIRKNKEFKLFERYLIKKKYYLLVIIAALSLGFSQWLNTPSKAGYLYGYVLVIEPFLMAAIVAFLFYQNSESVKKILIPIILSVFFTTLVTIASFGLLISNFREGFLRFGGGAIGSPTIAAAIYFTWAIISLGIFFQRKSTVNSRTFALVSLVILIVLGVITHTRGPLIYSSLGILIFFKTASKISFNKVLPLLFLIVLVSMLSGDVIYEQVTKRTVDIGNLRADGSFSERLARTETALEVFLENPLVGIGFANPPNNERVSELYEIHFYVYNTLLSWFTYGGLLCGLSFIILNAKVFWSGISMVKYKGKEEIQYYLKIFLIIQFCWFIDYFTTANSLLFSFPISSIIYFYIVLGAIVGLTYHKKIEKRIYFDSVQK